MSLLPSLRERRARRPAEQARQERRAHHRHRAPLAGLLGARQTREADRRRCRLLARPLPRPRDRGLHRQGAGNQGDAALPPPRPGRPPRRGAQEALAGVDRDRGGARRAARGDGAGSARARSREEGSRRCRAPDGLRREEGREEARSGTDEAAAARKEPARAAAPAKEAAPRPRNEGVPAAKKSAPKKTHPPRNPPSESKTRRPDGRRVQEGRPAQVRRVRTRRVRKDPREDRRDPDGVRRARAQGGRPPRSGVRRVSPRVVRREGAPLRNEGSPDRVRPLPAPRESPDGHRLQPPRRSARGGAGLEDDPVPVRRRRATGISAAAPPTTRARRSRRSSARATRARTDVPVNIHFLWELEEEIGSPHFETDDQGATRRSSRPDSVVVSDTVWVSRARPAQPGGLARAPGLPLHAPDGRDRPALGHRRRRGAQPGHRALPADRRLRGRQDRPGQDPRLLRRRRAADEARARRPEELGLHDVADFKTRPPVPLAPRRRRARGHEARLDDADVRGPRDRRRVPGPGREDDHPAEGDGDRLLPARPGHEPEEDREARHRLREGTEPRREGVRGAHASGLQGQDDRAVRRRRSAAR